MMRGMMAFSQTGHRSGVRLGRAHESADEPHAVGQRRGSTHRVARGPVVDVGHLDAGVVEPCPAQAREEVLLLEGPGDAARPLSLIHISEPTRRTPISYAVFCLKKKKGH